MAVALAAIPELLEALGGMEELAGFSNILRVNSLFRLAKSEQKIMKVFNKDDMYYLAKKYKDNKKYINELKDKLFLNIQSHKFVFFTEQELRDYLYKIDANAKLIVIYDSDEITLYMAEFSDNKLSLSDNNGVFTIFMELAGLYFLSMNNIYFNMFMNDSIHKLEETTDNYINYLKDQQNKLINEIKTKIAYYKQLDQHNTYCLNCSCCCGCDKGSCCCSCHCSLVHYLQAWDKLESDLIAYVNTMFNNLINTLKTDYLDRNNKNSFIMEFITILAGLLFNLKHKNNNKYLFAVIKHKEVVKNHEKGKKLRYIISLVKSFKGKKIERSKLYAIVKKAYETKFNKKMSIRLFDAYLSKLRKNWVKIKTIKENKKIYYLVE